jgi:RimJ/RimL family protein N-acetyltransferase
MNEIPVLETPRLVLRGHHVDDFPSAAALWADPVVTRFIGRPSTIEESWARMTRYAGHWSLLNYGFWAFIDKETGRFAGEGGLADFKRDIAWPNNVAKGEDAREVGWALAPEFHGRGLATEGMQAVTAWADRRFPATRTICIIDPANTPSVAVAQRCGYAEIGATQYKEKDVLVLAR